MTLPGVTAAEADRIIAGRPYDRPEDIVTRQCHFQKEHDRISDLLKVVCYRLIVKLYQDHFTRSAVSNHGPSSSLKRFFHIRQEFDSHAIATLHECPPPSLYTAPLGDIRWDRNRTIVVKIGVQLEGTLDLKRDLAVSPAWLNVVRRIVRWLRDLFTSALS